MSYAAGHAAELRIARDYESRGFRVAQHRWRGRSGEIDLITKDQDGVVFVEVKQSRSFERAAERITPRQIKRICSAASEYLAGEPDGQLTNVRFDVALVDGRGACQILENAFFAA
jgi:putative endonuclease